MNAESTVTTVSGRSHHGARRLRRWKALSLARPVRSGGVHLVVASCAIRSSLTSQKTLQYDPNIVAQRIMGVPSHTGLHCRTLEHMVSSTLPFFSSSRFLPFAHRGGSEETLENTLPAFQAAYDAGFRYFETDLHATRDGVVVAFHDDNLERIAGVPGTIGDCTYKDLRSLTLRDPAHRAVPSRSDVLHLSIPTLEELFTTFPDCSFNLDLKHDACLVPLVRIIRAHQLEDRICAGSFDDARLARFRIHTHGRVATSMGPRAVLDARIRSFLFHRTSRHEADCIQVPVRAYGIPILTRSFIDAAHRSGLPVHAWTINDAPLMEHLLDLGIDGIMTDRPHLLRTVLAERGLWENR